MTQKSVSDIQYLLKNHRAYVSQTNEFQSLQSLTPLIGELTEYEQIQANPLSWKMKILMTNC